MRLIDADELMELLRLRKDSGIGTEIDEIKTVEAIPIELYEQVKGERDVAVEQLKSLNIELFEKPYRKAITIEWIVNKWAKKFWKIINDKKYYTGDGYDTVWDMLEDWEKENADNS